MGMIIMRMRIEDDLDEDSLTSLRLLLNPLHRLVGRDVDTKFLRSLKIIITVIVIILSSYSTQILAPCCGDQHSHPRLLMVTHTLIGHWCCLRNISMTTMMTTMMMASMRMEPNNCRIIVTEAPWSKLLSCLWTSTSSPPPPPPLPPPPPPAGSPARLDTDPLAEPFPPPPLKLVWNLRLGLKVGLG